MTRLLNNPLVGSLIGGFVVGQLADPGLLAAVVGGWVGSVLLSEIYGLATGGLKRG